MRRMLVALCFMAVTTAVVLAPIPAFALPCCSKQYVFYSDCSFTTMVGHHDLQCSGIVDTSGTVDWSLPWHYTSQSCGNDSPSCDFTECGGGAYYCQ